MAAPHLKTTAPAGAPRRVLLPSGTAPKSQPKLKTASGQPIPAKKPALKAPGNPASAPSSAPKPAVNPAAEEEAARLAARQAAEAAEAEASRKAQEEYERQMEEYNRQMEEYNRAMAAQAEAEAAAKAAAEEATRQAAEAAAAEQTVGSPAPAASSAPAAAKPKLSVVKPKLSVAKPDAAKPSVKPAAKPAVAKPAAKSAAKPMAAKPAAKPAPAPVPAPDADDGAVGEEAAPVEQGMTEEEYIRLQQLAAKPPIWKTVPFWVAAGGLIALAIGCTIYVVNNNAAAAARKAEIDGCNKILRRALEINKKGIESLSDARSKNVDVSCNKDEAQKLLSIVVNPYAKDDKGVPAYGGNPDGVAQLACLLLALASESDPAIDKLIFDTLNVHAQQIKPAHYRWLIQRMAISNNKGINSKFRKLADNVSKQPQWNKKGEVLSYIWEAMGLRVSKKDVPDIVSLLKDEAMDNQLAGALAKCLDNILLMTDDMAEKQKLGDEIFTALPEKYRGKMLGSFGRACSPKALAYYKKRAEDTKNWRIDQEFFANYYSDDIIPYLQELQQKAGDDAKLAKTIEMTIRSVVAQNRDRSPEEADKLLSLVFDKLNADTSAWDEILNKTDPDAAAFVGEDSPEYEKLMEQRKELETCREQKRVLINTLSGMHNYKWVTNLLDSYAKDADSDIAIAAKRAREAVDRNTAEDAAMHAKYKSRDKN